MGRHARGVSYPRFDDIRTHDSLHSTRQPNSHPNKPFSATFLRSGFTISRSISPDSSISPSPTTPSPSTFTKNIPFSVSRSNDGDRPIFWNSWRGRESPRSKDPGERASYSSFLLRFIQLGKATSVCDVVASVSSSPNTQHKYEIPSTKHRALSLSLSRGTKEGRNRATSVWWLCILVGGREGKNPLVYQESSGRSGDREREKRRISTPRFARSMLDRSIFRFETYRLIASIFAVRPYRRVVEI